MPPLNKKTDHIQMLCDIGEMNRLFAESISIESFLQKIVEMVASHMHAEVSSIYLFDEHRKLLVLKATVGLNRDYVNQVELDPGEGLVGLAFRELRTIYEKTGSDNPHYKYVPGIFEELYETFLAVPIVLGTIRVGVLVVQRGSKKQFNQKDILALQATSSQLASMIENAKMILMISQEKKPAQRGTWSENRFIRGEVASRGYAHAPALVFKRRFDIDEIYSEACSDFCTLDGFRKALRDTEEQLEALQEKVEERLDDAASLIFAAQLLMLKDSSFTRGIEELIQSGVPSHEAVVAQFRKYHDIFQTSSNARIREKVQDLEDLVRRMLENMLDIRHEEEKLQGHIIIVRELFPSDMLRMSAEGIQGIVLVSGGVTSHLSILARSLEIPVVITSESDLLELSDETLVLLDAEVGNIYVDPSEDVVENFEKRNRERLELLYNRDLVEKPALTRDGHRVSVMVNINLLSDLNRVKSGMVDGIGLYRTEFPFLIRNDFPSEEEQYVIYKKLLDTMGEKPVVFRTLDIGGDKVLSYYDDSGEKNPFLGMRSIRFSLTHEKLFMEQLRAILRAGAGYPIRIMFPMISSYEEFSGARRALSLAREELERDGLVFNDSPEIGVMVELPSAVMVIEDIAPEVDFISIGTNDLIQYTLAVDRTNEKVAHLYIPHHPSILRSLERVARAGKDNSIPVSVCGDMGSSSLYIPFLVGIGIDTLSVDPGAIPQVKKTIHDLDYGSARDRALELIRKKTVKEIEATLGLVESG